MKILVIGASGRTGNLLLKLAINGGHTVSALVRDPRKLAQIKGIESIIQGDALDQTLVNRAVKEQDVVVTTVAAPSLKPSTVVSEITKTVVDAMLSIGTKRLVITSSRNVVATKPWLAVSLSKLIFGNVYADLARAERIVRESNLDWTIVRGVQLKDEPSRGATHIDDEINATGGRSTLPREDYAAVLLSVAENADMIGKAIGVNGV